MDTGGGKGLSRYERWSRKSDMDLAGIVRETESEEETEVVMQILRDRYETKLKGFVYNNLQSPDWADSVTVDTWVGLYRSMRAREVRKSVSGLLFQIARNKCADAVRDMMAQRKRDQKHLSDLSGDDLYSAMATQSLKEDLEEPEEVKEVLDLFHHSPYMHAALTSDYQRVIWMLRQQHRYPPMTVARLIGRDRSIIDNHVSRAGKQLKKFYASEEFELTLASEELGQLWQPARVEENVTVIERFAKPMLPNLTSDELKPLGLTNEELNENYNVSLVLPRWFDIDGALKTSPPSYLLTRMPDWKNMEKIFERLSRNPDDLPDEFSEECMVRIKVDESGKIKLRIEPMLQVIPEDPDELLYSDTVLSVHRYRLKIPVVLGFYGHSEYTPELLNRWPFVTPDMGL